jgi:hypothetical protein
VLHPRHHLLADIAALAEAHAAELIEIGLMRKERARTDILDAVGDAQRDPPRPIFASVRVAHCRGIIVRNDRTIAHFANSRIGEDDGGWHVQRTARGQCGHPHPRDRLDRQRRPELVEHEPLLELLKLLAGTIDQIGITLFQHQKIEQDLALGGEQRRPARRACGEAGDIGRDQPLQEARAVLAAEPEHRPVGEDRRLESCHGCLKR